MARPKKIERPLDIGDPATAGFVAGYLAAAPSFTKEAVERFEKAWAEHARKVGETPPMTDAESFDGP